MDNIIVFSRYAIRAPGFGVSLHKMLQMAFMEIGVGTKFISEYDDLVGIKNSTILFLIKPGVYLSHLDKIDSSNTNVIWNLEPFSLSHVGDKKLDGMRGLYSKMLHDMPKYKLRHILFFDKRQADLFIGKKCSYMPIGFHPCLSSDKKYREKNNTALLFVGKTERKRRRDFSALAKIMKSKGRSIRKIDHSVFQGLHHNNDLMAEHYYGINHHDRDRILHIHWHRIMMYAANRVAIISQDDLSAFGFKHGKHYIYYKNISEIGKINFGDYGLFEAISENMLDKIKKEYVMSDLLRSALK